MPGTDLCIKVGGWVRAEADSGQNNGSMTWGPFAGNANQLTTSNFAFRARGYITADVRNQTEYGTVRGYLAVGVNTNDAGLYGSPAVPPSTFSSNRAFVQWAGMTAGISQSFYDFYAVPAMSLRGGYFPASDTGDPGWMVWAYTAQFGNGFSASVSAEARRTTQIIDQQSATGAAGAAGGAFFANSGGSIVPGSYYNTLSCTTGAAAGACEASGGAALFAGNGAYGGSQMPDIIANLRVDQAWGGAQIMGALHEDNASYYSTAVGGNPAYASLASPGYTWGWVAGAGLKINAPFITQGDWFQAQFNYTQGALRYLFFTPNTNWGGLNGSKEAYGVLSDCVYGGTTAATQTSCQLTTAWGFNAGYEHFWTPALHTSLIGSYYIVNYNASANAMLCSASATATAANGAGIGSAAVALGSCNNNWSTWNVGSRTQWDVTKTFYLGLEVMYSQLNSATPFGGNGGIVGGSAQGALAPIVQTSSMGAWNVSVRAHRDFLP
jgi:hypothetical protein